MDVGRAYNGCGGRAKGRGLPMIATELAALRGSVLLVFCKRTAA